MWLCCLASVGISVHVADCLFWRRRFVPPSVLIRNAADHRQPSCSILKNKQFCFPRVLYRLTPSEDFFFILGFVCILLLLNNVKKARCSSRHMDFICVLWRFESTIYLSGWGWTSFSDVLFVVTLLFYSHVLFRDKVVIALYNTMFSSLNMSRRSPCLSQRKCLPGRRTL